VIAVGPVAARRKSNGDAILVIALDTSPVRCLCIRAEDGQLEWVDREETVFTGWSFDPHYGIWVSESDEEPREE